MRYIYWINKSLVRSLSPLKYIPYLFHRLNLPNGLFRSILGCRSAWWLFSSITLPPQQTQHDLGFGQQHADLSKLVYPSRMSSWGSLPTLRVDVPVYSFPRSFTSPTQLTVASILIFTKSAVCTFGFRLRKLKFLPTKRLGTSPSWTDVTASKRNGNRLMKTWRLMRPGLWTIWQPEMGLSEVEIKALKERTFKNTRWLAYTRENLSHGRESTKRSQAIFGSTFGSPPWETNFGGNC